MMTERQAQEALAIVRDIFTGSIHERHSGKTTRREWGRNGWLYPGDAVIELDGEIMKRMETLLAECDDRSA